jgi:hypothetical protein
MTEQTEPTVEAEVVPAIVEQTQEEMLRQRVADLTAEQANIAMLYREASYEYTSKGRLRIIALGIMARYNYFLGTALAAAEELRQQDEPQQEAPAGE